MFLLPESEIIRMAWPDCFRVDSVQEIPGLSKLIKREVVEGLFSLHITSSLSELKCKDTQRAGWCSHSCSFLRTTLISTPLSCYYLAIGGGGYDLTSRVGLR